MRNWTSEIRARLRGSKLTAADENDVIEEWSQHLDDRYRELLASGVSDEEAVTQVLIELDGSDRVRLARARADRAMDLGSAAPGAFEGLWRDVRHGFRSLRLNAGFALAAMLALGLGTGAATAVFSLLDGVVLRPLPYAEPERLVMLWDENQTEEIERSQISPVNFMDYRALPGVFDDAAAWWRPEVNLVDEFGDPIRVSTVEVSENFFDVMGVSPIVGRSFPRDSTLHDPGEPEVVISHRLWQTRFGGRQDVLGETLQMNGFPYVVVGVAPSGFHFPEDTDVWQRLSWDLTQHSRGAHFMGGIGRLRAGVTAERANADMTALARRLGEENPSSNEGWRTIAVPLQADLTGAFGPGLIALFGAAGLLLLIACINVANLLLARGSSRRSEVAVRYALGASRWRLVRQLLVENGILAVCGAALGLLIATLSVRAFLAWSPIEIPRADTISMNAPVLAFAAGTALLTALLFGLAPALLSTRTSLQSTLKDASRGSTGRLARNVRRMLIVTQVALAVALLCGAGLLIRSVRALLDEQTGVQAGDLVVVDVQLADAEYSDWGRVASFYGTLLAGLRAEPSIRSAGAGNFQPLEAGWRVQYDLPERQSAAGATYPGGHQGPPADLPMAQYHTVDEGYFRTLGVPLIRGRLFTARDDTTSPGVVIVNEAFARVAWPGEDPIGKRLIGYARNVGPLGRRISPEMNHEVIGVVADVKNTALTAEAEPAIYSSVLQFPFRRMYLFVDGRGNAANTVALIREHVQRVDPRIPLGEVKSLERVLAVAADPPRFVMLLMTSFAALALILAAIGIYGILAHTVSQRRGEIGIRMALGARPADVLQMIVSEGLALALAGALLGVLAAAASGRVLSSLLYEVAPLDPVTLILVPVTMLGVAAIACTVPGRRAALMNPTRTLRGE